MDVRLRHDMLDYYSAYMNILDFEYIKSVVGDIYNMGFTINENGQLFYAAHFKPLSLSCELLFVRHGETYGNCGQITSVGAIDHKMVAENKKNANCRIFQGNVDTEINQLTTFGGEQAKKLVTKLDQFILKNWMPDVILYSPLKRARDTALPFVEKYNFHDRFIKLDMLREMSFGEWDNRRVCDFNDADICHQFYKLQNALVKKTGVNGNGDYHEAENFIEVLVRAQQVLNDLNMQYSNLKVLIFSHSMFGAACKFLLGKGETVEKGDHLGFDGSYIIPCATPSPLNFWCQV